MSYKNFNYLGCRVSGEIGYKFFDSTTIKTEISFDDEIINRHVFLHPLTEGGLINRSNVARTGSTSVIQKSETSLDQQNGQDLGKFQTVLIVYRVNRRLNLTSRFAIRSTKL